MLKAGKKVGILGGGQLARMLAQSALNMGLEPWIFHKAGEAPAPAVCPNTYEYQAFTTKELKAFLSKVDIATFESEFLDGDLLKQASKSTNTKIYPDPSLMNRIRDRKTQKELLAKFKIPTADFLTITSEKDLTKAIENLGNNLVLKQRFFGYDGYGILIEKNIKSASSIWKKIKDSKEGFIAESFVPFKKEMAFMAFRSSTGECRKFPLVESYQENARCLWVKGPCKNIFFESAWKRIKKMMNECKYVGALGVEFFDTGKGLIVNELAPRVHNSGHYSMDGLSQSQFDWHLKCILGQSLGKVSISNGGFAMYNLLGTGKKNLRWTLPKEANLHWYGKLESRKGRKMGHLNAVGTTSQKAFKKLILAKKDIQI